MEAIVPFIFGYVYAAASATLAQVLVLFAPLIILAFLLNALGRFIGRTCIGVLRPSLFLLLLGWLGTLIHELGHVIFALLFFRKILHVKWFTTDPWDYEVGHVWMARSRNLYQQVGNFFIGLGPLLIGTLVIYLVAWGLFGFDTFTGMDQTRLTGDAFTVRTVGLILQRIVNSAGAVIAGVFTGSDHTLGAVFLFVYITLSIGTAMTLSPPDIAGVKNGFFALLLAFFFFNLATFWSGNYGDLFIAWIAPVYDLFYGVMIFGLIINATLALLLTPIAVLERV